MRKNNKAQAGMDIFLIVVLIFVTGTTLFFINYLNYNIANSLAEKFNQTAASASAENTIRDDSLNAMIMFDNLFPFYLLGLFIWLIISAFYISTHPIMFVFSIITVAISILLAVILANTFSSMVVYNPMFSSYLPAFYKIAWIINRMPFIIPVIAFVIFIILFSKSGSRNQGWGNI